MAILEPLHNADRTGLRRRLTSSLLLTLFSLGGGGEPAHAGDAARWERLAVGRKAPAARSEHAMAAIGDRIYLHGGRASFRRFKDLWMLNVTTARWSRIKTSKPQPQRRSGHNLMAGPDRTLLLLGGQNGGFFADAWSYDPATRSWRELPFEGPNGRYGAGAAMNPRNGIMYITHGFTDDGRFDDTWVLNQRRFVERSGRGKRPLRRCLLHSAFHRGELLLFGGQSNRSSYHSDLWRLDIKKGRWHKVRLPARRAGAKPSARNLYAAAQTDSNLYIHGGNGRAGVLGDLWRLDLKNDVFTRLMPDGDLPTARSGHAAAATKEGLVLFGGRSPALGTLNDTWLLSNL